MAFRLSNRFEVMRGFERALRNARNQLFKMIYAGPGCRCMFCGKTYRRFMHQGVRAEVFSRYRIAGAGFKKNVKCPNCGSNQRARLQYLFFELRTDIYQRKIRLLHISPMKQLAEVFLSHDNIDYLCGGLFPEQWAELSAVKVDVTDIQFGEGEFDVVICNHVLEHVREDRAAMGEIHRVLRPGGFAVLQVPLALDLEETLEDPSVADPGQRKALYGQKDHLRLYGVDYFERLGEAGFRVVRDNPFQNQWPIDPKQYCLDEKEDVIVAFKD